jgi:hypothetical protein
VPKRTAPRRNDLFEVFQQMVAASRERAARNVERQQAAVAAVRRRMNERQAEMLRDRAPLARRRRP